MNEKGIQQQQDQEEAPSQDFDSNDERSSRRHTGNERFSSNQRDGQTPIPSVAKSSRPSSQGLTPESGKKHKYPAFDGQRLTRYCLADLASGAALHSHLRCLVEEHTRRRDDAESTLGFTEHASDRDAGPATPQGVVWDDTAAVFEYEQVPEDLSAEESHRLHRLFMCYMGVTQHFLDNRAFTDNLTVFYRSARSRAQMRDSLWYVQYLLILAMGKLLDDRLGTTQPPGAEFFGEALRRLPSLHGLGGAGSIGVEILALTATYLQWVGKKHDAYLYVCYHRIEYMTMADQE